MTLGLTDDQRALAESLRDWARDRGTTDLVPTLAVHTATNCAHPNTNPAHRPYACVRYS